MGANAWMAGMGAGCDAEARSFSTIARHTNFALGLNFSPEQAQTVQPWPFLEPSAAAPSRSIAPWGLPSGHFCSCLSSLRPFLAQHFLHPDAPVLLAHAAWGWASLV